MPGNRQPDLILAGFGSSDALQITVEAQQTAARVGQVLGLGLPGRLQELLQRQGAEVTDLGALCKGEEFAGGYAKVAEAVLARAKDHPPVMFLSQGSPLFLNAISRYLVVEAKKLGLGVRVLPAVSPVDAVVAELGVDVGMAGLQTLSARGLVARPGVVNPRMPLLVLQVAGAATDGASPQSYAGVVGALQEAYPESQPITLLNMPGDGRVTRATVTLARFEELVAHIDTSSSLFVDIGRRKPSAGAE